MRLLNSVREQRQRLGLTQAELAERAGVSRQTIVAIEGDDYTPSAQLAAVLAREFGVPFEDVFRLEEAISS